MYPDESESERLDYGFEFVNDGNSIPTGFTKSDGSSINFGVQYSLEEKFQYIPPDNIAEGTILQFKYRYSDTDSFFNSINQCTFKIGICFNRCAECWRINGVYDEQYCKSCFPGYYNIDQNCYYPNETKPKEMGYYFNGTGF